jgi:hypothetical protein
MDPFEPIRVDQDARPAPYTERERPPQSAATALGTDRPRMDVADAAPAVAQTMLVLAAIEGRSDAAMAGAAEVTGAAMPSGEPIAVVADPPDGYPGYPEGSGSAADGGDGCLGGAFALLFVLTTAAGTAVALVR